MVWQKYNCQSCHQLYGLGGYLGPDLTNLVSQQGKSDEYIAGIIRSGTKQMPAFSITDDELQQLIQFLNTINLSGKANPSDYKISPDGMFYEKNTK